MRTRLHEALAVGTLAVLTALMTSVPASAHDHKCDRKKAGEGFHSPEDHCRPAQ